MSSDESPSRLVYRPTVPDRGGSGAGADAPATADGDRPPETLEGQLVAGRYQVEKLLGVGGMGCVYRAEHVLMRKTVALKTLHPEMTQLPEAVARFEREAIAASRIDHPNVAAATDFGRLDDGSYFLVLQFVEGKSLRATIDECGKLPVDRALRVARQVASALKAAHALDIVHRDLKPDNVMLVAGEQGESIKVLDFGIAKVTVEGSGGLTRMGSVFGTPEYMSPEQCMGQPVDARSDLYALGVILYEMLSGRRPFHGAEAVVLLRKQIMEPPPPLDAEVPPDVAAMVGALLAKSTVDRVQSAGDLILAIDGILAGVPAAGDAPSGVSAATAPVPTSMRSASLPNIPPASAPVASVPQPAAISIANPPVSAASAPASLAMSARKTSSPLDELRVIASHPVRIGTATVPLLAVALVAAVPVVLGVVGVVILAVAVRACSGSGAHDSPDEVSAPAASSSEPAASASARTSPEAGQGAEAQIDRIEAVPVYKRTDDDWVVLARSYSEARRYEDAAKAYRSALSVRRTMRKDPVVLEDLKRAGRDPAAFPIVLNLCETVLGGYGLELMWELWQEARHDPTREDQADKLHKKLTILSRRASPALRIAIELDATSNCAKLAAILPRAVKDADVRSVERLDSLAKTTGCGDAGKTDCYPCLRVDTALLRATERARTKPAPKLGQTPDSDY